MKQCISKFHYRLITVLSRIAGHPDNPYRPNKNLKKKKRKAAWIIPAIKKYVAISSS